MAYSGDTLDLEAFRDGSVEAPFGELTTDFSPVIEAHRKTALVELQLHSYSWTRPSHGHFVSSVGGLLDYALGARPISGRGKYVTQSGPQRPLGEIFYVPRGVPMEAHVDSGQARSLRCLMHVGRIAELAEMEDEGQYLEEGLSICCERLREAMLRLFHELLHPGFTSSLLIDAYAIVAYVELQRHLRAAAPSADEACGRMAAWQLRVIDDRLQEASLPPNLAELARLCRVSSRHLMRTFRQSTGETVGSYVARAQMARARHLLTRSDRPIKRIAHDLGFSSPASFSRAFRIAAGLSPNQYRRTFMLS